MAQAGVIDVAAIVENQRRGGFLVTFLTLSSLMTFFDGYDNLAISYVAPSIIRDWHLDRAAFAVVFSAGTFGMAIGCAIFGFVSDRFGRKPTAAFNIFLFGLASFFTIFTSTLTQIAIARFAAGIGIGALMPIIYAMCVELVPHNMRATAVTIVVAAFNVGAILGGITAAWLIPVYGWTIVYWIASVVPIVTAIAMMLTLPESPRFLVSRGRPAAEIAAVLRRIDKTVALPAGARFIDGSRMSEQEGSTRSTFAMLFQGRLAIATPLLWASYFFCAVAVFLISSWTPTLAQALGISARFSALALTTFSLGTLIASLGMMRFLDWYGTIIIPIFPVVACPAFVLLGLASVSDATFMALMFVVGVGIGGGLNGLHSVVGLFYPNACRATGTSWAVGVSRVGGIVGPGLAGLLLALGLSVKGIFLVTIVPTLLFALCAYGLGLIHNSLLRGARSPAGGVAEPVARPG